MTDEAEVAVATDEDVETNEPQAIPMDCDVTGWTLAEQMAYREKTRVNPQYAMLMIGKAFETEDPEVYSNIDPTWLLGIAWITARRKNKSLTMEALAEPLEYGALLTAVIAWAQERAVADPPPPPKRRAKRS